MTGTISMADMRLAGRKTRRSYARSQGTSLFFEGL
jgi:hypothetical protein